MWRKSIVGLALFISTAAVADDVAFRVFREGAVYWQAGNNLKAYGVFDSIPHALPPIDDLRLYATGDAALKTGRIQRATALFEKLISEYPNSPWRAAVEAALAQMQSRPESVEIAPALNADSTTLNLYATELFRSRDYKKAVPVLAELLRRKGGQDQSLMITLASAYARSDHYDEAIALQRKIIAFPSEARRALYKIVFLEADRNHDKEAIVAAQEYLGKFPNGSERHKVMWIEAWSYYRLKEWTPALTHLQAYGDDVGSQEEKRRAEYWIARALEQMGNKMGAVTAYGVISGQNASDYYGHLASARLRHKPLAWSLPPAKKIAADKLNPESAASLLYSMGLYEFAPVVGWSGSYRDLIDKAAPVAGLTPSLVNAIVQVESHFRADAVSPAGAIGLMQLIPPTATELADDLHLGTFTTKKLLDPIWNVTLGMAYFHKLSAMFSRQQVPMIASYNAGEQAVQRWISKTSLADPEMFIEEIPYDETYAYVKHVLTLIW